MMKTISILGSTGSIGKQALDLCRRHPDRYRVAALTARSSKETLFETYKNDCISTIDEISDDDNKSRLFAMKQQLSEKKYNEETLIEDLFNLAELKKTLLEA